MGRTFILLKGEKLEQHHEVFQTVKEKARKSYDSLYEKLKNTHPQFGFRGRYDIIDEKTYEQMSNSELVLKTLGKEIEGLYFSKRGLSTFVPEEKPVHGLISSDVYGLFTIYNESFFWDLARLTDKIHPMNFETLMFYQSFSPLVSQPIQNMFSPHQLTINSGPEGVAITTRKPSSERVDVKIEPIPSKENEKEYYEFGKCPNEPWSLFPDISEILKNLQKDKR